MADKEKALDLVACLPSSSNKIKNGGSGKGPIGAGATLARVQQVNDTRSGKWSIPVATDYKHAYVLGVRAGEAWNVGVNPADFCDISEIYCSLQPIPGQLQVMSDIEAAIGGSIVASGIVVGQIKAVQNEIDQCELVECPEAELEALFQKLKGLEQRLANMDEAQNQLSECWETILSFFDAAYEGGFPPGFPDEYSVLKKKEDGGGEK